jgi:hypothetical protein
MTPNVREVDMPLHVMPFRWHKKAQDRRLAIFGLWT